MKAYDAEILRGKGSRYLAVHDPVKRFNVRWSTATPKEKLFIEGITRFEYEKDYAKRMGLPTDKIKPVFNLSV